jgi:hypothetical protein
MPDHKHIGSLLYYFYGWSLREPALRFRMINEPGTYQVHPDIIHIPVTQMPKFHVAEKIASSYPMGDVS